MLENKDLLENKKVHTYDSIVEDIARLHNIKAADYGTSVHTAYQEFGPISLVVRLHDKLSRLKNLLKNNKEIQVKNESLVDTALDMANYSIMLAEELLNDETIQV